jgi:hypothetical protein
VQHLPVPVIPPVQQVLPPVQPVPTQNQGVQAEPVVANGENLLNMPCTISVYTKPAGLTGLALLPLALSMYKTKQKNCQNST